MAFEGVGPYWLNNAGSSSIPGLTGARAFAGVTPGALSLGVASFGATTTARWLRLGVTGTDTTSRGTNNGGPDNVTVFDGGAFFQDSDFTVAGRDRVAAAGTIQIRGHVTCSSADPSFSNGARVYATIQIVNLTTGEIDPSHVVTGGGAFFTPILGDNNFNCDLAMPRTVIPDGSTLYLSLWIYARGVAVTNQTITLRGSNNIGFEDNKITLPGTGLRYVFKENPTGAMSATSGAGQRPVASLSKIAKKALLGSLLPAGAIQRLIKKPLTAALTPGGVLLKTARKPLTGAAGTPTGSMVRTARKALAGSVGSTGALVRLARKALAGASTPTGALTRQVYRFFTGAVGAPAGALRKVPLKYFTASAGAPTGAVTRRPVKLLTGGITPSPGALRRFVYRFFAGSLTPAGALTKLLFRALSGAVTSSGSLRKVPNKPLAGTIAAAPGELLRAVVKRMTGTLSSTGALTRTLTRRLEATITSTATLKLTLGKNFLGFLYGIGKTGDWPLNEPLKAIAGTVIDHEDGSAWTGGAEVVLHRDVDDEPVAYATSNGAGAFSFPRGDDDPYTYHYKTHYEKNGVPYQGVSERGQVPA